MNRQGPVRHSERMKFVGVDLAWAGRNHTGIAVLDDAGVLTHLASATTDDDILGIVEPVTAAACVVAFDAPIVVTNPTGARPAERALNRVFAAFDAGAHPSNTTKPEFAGSPRAARLATRLGLVVPEPAEASGPTAGPLTGRRVAVEVYPHPATIALFRLGRTLKYKQKPGRPLDHLRAELRLLIGCVEGLATADPPLRVLGHPGWADLVARVAGADRKRGLRPAEDEVDAVICAYIALLAARRPAGLTAYGTAADGFILTPTLPAGQLPSPRSRVAGVVAEPLAPPVAGDPVRAAIEVYAVRHPELVTVTAAFAALVTARLDDAGINYLSVTSRTKSIASFAGKATRTVDGGRPFTDPLTQITDQIGLRVITYLHGDVAAVADLLADQFDVLDDRDMGQERPARAGSATPAGTCWWPPTPPGTAPPVRRAPRATGVGADQDRAAARVGRVRARHPLQGHRSGGARARPGPAVHAGGRPAGTGRPGVLRDPRPAAGHHVRSRRRPRRRPGRRGRTRPGIEAADLATFLAARFRDAGWSRTDHYEWISGLLLELGITSLDELATVLAAVDTDGVDARMAYRYPAGAVRRLDDALLAQYRERYVRLTGNAARAALLRARLDKLGPAPLQGSSGPST